MGASHSLGCYISEERVSVVVVTYLPSESLRQLLHIRRASHILGCYRHRERVKSEVVTGKKSESCCKLLHELRTSQHGSCYRFQERVMAASEHECEQLSLYSECGDNGHQPPWPLSQ